MKTTQVILSTALVALMAGCQTEPKESEAYKQLLQEHERMMTESAQKDSTLTMVLSTFGRISDNLRAIRSKEGQLVGPPPAAEAGDVEESILADIQSIDGLLAENKKLIAQLRKQTKGSAEKIAQLETAIASLEQQVADKGSEVAALKQQLAGSNRAVQYWFGMYKDKEQLAALQEAEMNTAYYVAGSSKDLREKGVLTKEGGIAGIGATDKMKTEGLNKESFQQIDLSQTSAVVIGAKKARLATPHPDGSYTWENGGEKLVIQDKDEFWSLSKYLVVVMVK
jgi:ABC-type uncharacterized transport system auxiliary subunit